jgi:hypothetical protein
MMIIFDNILYFSRALFLYLNIRKNTRIILNLNYSLCIIILMILLQINQVIMMSDSIWQSR